MELRVARALLELPPADVLDAARPPAGALMSAAVQLPFAKARVRVNRQAPVDAAHPGGDWWLGVWLALEDRGAAAAAPASWASSGHVGATAHGGEGRRQLLGGCASKVESLRAMWAAGVATGSDRAFKWSQLQEAARSGAALEFTAVFVDFAAPLGAGAALRVAPPAGSLSARRFFGGPFSDITIVCGSRRFEAHRLALAIASPVFHSMLSSEIAKGSGAPEMEIREADPAALELLLRHAYGAAVDVPLALAPQLCGLADRFQLRTDLAEQLQLWLSTVEVQPAVLCELLPAAHTLCPYAFHTNLCWGAAAAISQVVAAPAFGSWPVDLVIEVMQAEGVGASSAFSAVAAWMAAQQQPAKQRHRWPALLGAVRWEAAAEAELAAIRAHGGAAAVPGLQDRLIDALFRLCRRYKRAQP